MELHRTRLFFIISLVMIGVLLYGEWQREHPTVFPVQDKPEIVSMESDAIPVVPPEQASRLLALEKEKEPSFSKASLIHVDTDVFKVGISPTGGDLVYAQLKKYFVELNSQEGETLLNSDFVAQTGLVGKNGLGPDSKQQGRAQYTVKSRHYPLNTASEMQVDLYWQGQGIEVIKSYVFKKGSYLVEVLYTLINHTDEAWQGAFYGQLRRQWEKTEGKGILGIQTYQGGALYTPEKPYKKLSYADMKKKVIQERIQGGWTAFVDHYFLCAFIPPKAQLNHYFTRVDAEHVYNLGASTPFEVPAHAQGTVKGAFYIGPEDAETLKAISPGLNLTIDYGILWPISFALFWLLKNIHHYVGNWGWSIILVTLFIKILFYQLSAKSYRSMGQMRQLQPRIEALKQRHGDNKQQFSAALMELYKKEKINPLGGCLPILIQIPVFIALYYVLLESIELRQAPFILWIKDLSTHDPYYVLPLIMGGTMFWQQKMNPAPPDPIQAKVMMFMPVIFTALFLSFPSGLVLYWVVNNLLSILQQWFITSTLHKK